MHLRWTEAQLPLLKQRAPTCAPTAKGNSTEAPSSRYAIASATCGTGVNFQVRLPAGPVLPNPCLRTASPSYRSARAAQPGCPARAATPRRILLRHTLRRASRRDPRTQQHRAPAEISSRRPAATTHTPMPKKRNASAPAASPANAGRHRQKIRRAHEKNPLKQTQPLKAASPDRDQIAALELAIGDGQPCRTTPASAALAKKLGSAMRASSDTRSRTPEPNESAIRRERNKKTRETATRAKSSPPLTTAATPSR